MQEDTLKKRPKHLNLFVIKLPLPGFVSILHRVSGAGLFIMLPAMIFLLDLSLGSAQDFATFKAITSHILVRLVLLGLIWSYAHHFCAGIRFLLLDLHIGGELKAARASSWMVLAVSLAITGLAAIPMIGGATW